MRPGVRGLFKPPVQKKMTYVIVDIMRFIDCAQPGWVECRLTDAAGNKRFFREKVPVVSTEDLDEQSIYPCRGVIACEIVGTGIDDDGCEIVTIDTDRPWGCEALDGGTRFDVLQTQLETEPSPGSNVG